MIITVSGFIGSGKDTVSQYLQESYGFRQVSFAGTLKDAVSAVFGWNREMLEGRTAESRAWREQVDTWWAERLDIPHLTPRWVLQYWGTEVCRRGFHDDIWIASLENRLRNSNENIVISDARFPNELATIRRLNGSSIRVIRGANPSWYDLAVKANSGDQFAQAEIERLVHSSEWAWVGYDFDSVIDNNLDLNWLYHQVDNIVKNPDAAPWQTKSTV
jgi:hypothetical protein